MLPGRIVLFLEGVSSKDQVWGFQAVLLIQSVQGQAYVECKGSTADLEHSASSCLHYGWDSECGCDPSVSTELKVFRRC